MHNSPVVSVASLNIRRSFGSLANKFALRSLTPHVQPKQTGYCRNLTAHNTKQAWQRALTKNITLTYYLKIRTFFFEKCTLHLWGGFALPPLQNPALTFC
jgi:hypothetical protein